MAANLLFALPRIGIKSLRMIRQRIRDALAAKGITQKQLADAVGVAPQTICDYLSGRRNLPYDTLEKTFNFLGL